MSENLLEACFEKSLLGDGAMGTQLQLAGLEAGGCGEQWNITRASDVEKIQRAYVDAGSDILITNTFGGCRLSLQRHGVADQVVEINRAAVEIARSAFVDNPGFVLGDIGTFGGMMEPYGDIKEVDVRAALYEQAQALVSAGVDGIIVETQISFEEAAIGIAAASEAGANCIIVSFSYDVTEKGDNLFTMMGINPEAAAEFAEKSGAHMIGINCGTGIDLDWAIDVTRRYRNSCHLPVMVQPNAGQPELIDFKVVYLQKPEEMADKVIELAETGASIIGACCGSTPETIKAMRAKLDLM